MTIPIDILIINNVPSFYKVNLYNELAKRCKIHVVFIALTNQVVIEESFQENIQFSYELLSSIQIEKRNRWQSLKRLYSICKSYNYQKIIYGGYDDVEQRVLLFLTPKSKNCLQFESSIRESKVTGVIAVIKKLFFSRISIALPSGKLQTAVFEALGYKGTIIETKGVGIFNKSCIKEPNKISQNPIPNYIYVGRLIPVKNLEFLIAVFNAINKPLTIVGAGIFDPVLKKQANSNIKFTGFVPNEDLGGLYNVNDIFILPSISEPWGLVVEEAVYFGLPVLVSDAVGCQEEMVLKPKTGIVFSPFDAESLKNAIKKMENNVEYYRHNCFSFDFSVRDTIQIEAYLKVLSI
jgi:glycosyltransferase involved in cell wall biosynthesis